MLQSMTEEQIDARIGQLFRKHDNLGKEIATLRDRAAELAKCFSQAADALRAQPEMLRFNGVGCDTQFYGGPLLNLVDLDGTCVLQLTTELREKIVERDQIAEKLQNMGMDVHRR